MKNKMPQYLERKMGTSTAQVEIGSGQSGVLDALNSSGLLHVIGSRGPAFCSCICSHTSVVACSSHGRGIYTKAIGTDCKSSPVLPENQCAVKTLTSPPVFPKHKVTNLWLQDLNCYLPRCHHKGNRCLVLFEKSHF